MDTYFNDADVPRADGAAEYSRIGALPQVAGGEGVTMDVLEGEGVLVSYVTLAPFAEAPMHRHVEEQLGLIISGSMDFELDGVSRRLGALDTYSVPPGVFHGGIAGPDGCIIVDAFSPPRQGLASKASTL